MNFVAMEIDLPARKRELRDGLIGGEAGEKLALFYQRACEYRRTVAD